MLMVLQEVASESVESSNATYRLIGRAVVDLAMIRRTRLTVMDGTIWQRSSGGDSVKIDIV